MTPFEIFTKLGHILLYWLLQFFEVSAWRLDPGLGTVFAFLLALIFWSWFLGIVSAVIKRMLGFAPRGW